MVELCRHCGSANVRGSQHDWASICRDCGELHWLLVGDVVECKAISVNRFGAIVEFADGVRGVIHVSEIGGSFPESAELVVAVGDELRAQVLGIDYERQRVGLSIRRLNS
jgi:predicted RNA-binding protein with RPS1 domain